MAVVANCEVCGKEHVVEGGLVFEGTIEETMGYIKSKEKEVTEKCCGGARS